MVLDSLTLTVESVVLGASEGALAAGKASLEWVSDRLRAGDALGGCSGCSCREHVCCLVVAIVSRL